MAITYTALFDHILKGLLLIKEDMGAITRIREPSDFMLEKLLCEDINDNNILHLYLKFIPAIRAILQDQIKMHNEIILTCQAFKDECATLEYSSVLGQTKDAIKQEMLEEDAYTTQLKNQLETIKNNIINSERFTLVK
jgi:hypothetical protein